MLFTVNLNVQSKSLESQYVSLKAKSQSLSSQKSLRRSIKAKSQSLSSQKSFRRCLKAKSQSLSSQFDTRKQESAGNVRRPRFIETARVSVSPDVVEDESRRPHLVLPVPGYRRYRSLLRTVDITSICPHERRRVALLKISSISS